MKEFQTTQHIRESIPLRGMSSSAWSVSAAILVSRILGLVREMVLARFFGAGAFTDAFYIAYRIPNLLRDLFAEGVLSSAMVPVFVRRISEDGLESAWILTNRLIGILLLVLGMVTLVIYFGAHGCVYLLAAGFSDQPEKFALTVQMTRILSPFLMFVSLASVAVAMLNACGRFFLPALASSAFNVSCILAAFFLSPHMPRWGMEPIISMAIGAIIGGAAQFLVMVPSSRSLGFRFRIDINFSDPGLKKIARLMLPAIVGVSAAQINITVDSQMASSYGNGPVSWLSYGFRLMQLPLGVFGAALATVALSSVSRHAASNSLEQVGRTVSTSLRLAACLLFPSAVGLMIFRNEIVELLYQRGSFTAADTLNTGNIVFLYALGLFSFAAVKIVAPTFYALQDSQTPLRSSLISVLVKIILNFALIRPMGFLGLPLATSASSWINLVLLWNRLRRFRVISFSPNAARTYAGITLASGGVGAVALIIYQISTWLLPQPTTSALALRLGASIMGAMLSLIPLLRLFQVREADELLRLTAGLFSRFR